MIKKKILLVEDDVRLAGLVSKYLQKHDYFVLVEHNGLAGIETIKNENPDLVILDLMLPGADGFSVCREIRNRYSGFIMIVTAQEDNADQIVGLELGADDYVKKPVEPRVLLARIRSLFRRTSQVEKEGVIKNLEKKEISFGKLNIDASKRAVFLDENEVKLTTIEFDALFFLACNSGKIVTRQMLSSHVRGIEYDGLNRSIDICISRIRKKLNDDTNNPYKIKTVWGSGYLFVEDAWN